MSRRRRQRHATGPGIIAVDGNHLPMLEVDRQHALRAVAAGRAKVLDIRTWHRLTLAEVRDLQAVQVIVYPEAKSVTEHRLGLGKGNKAVLRRDGWKCAYCLGRATTIDHVKPRAQGGASSWKNLIAACFACNQKKGARTPEEAGMRLLFPIRSPRYRLYEQFQEIVSGAA